uniref:hypothetical protein n=1 Tax=uncultured Flavobacterium sp. TaxID=165435 RepID=UPI0025DC4391
VLESGVYKLTGKLIVKANAKLTIKAGVTIEATDFVAGAGQSIRYIAVSQDGEIDVRGTSNNPVVMTSTTKTPGKWGGLVLCGRAPINKGVTASAEVSELTYGGNDAEDTSGSIKYLRIEYPGYAYNNDKEFNGLSFFGVGRGTTVENVEVYQSSDDGFEWFGGTVDTKNLVVFNSGADLGDDLFDWTEGWIGTNENWYGKRTNNGNRGIEADNNSNNHVAAPISNPTIKNLTLVGTGDADSNSEHQAMKLRVGTMAKFDNVVLSNWKVGFDVQHDESVGYVGAGTLKATNVKFENVTVKSKGAGTTAGTAPDVSAIYTESNTATGAGNGSAAPTWSQGWTLGL